MSEPIFNIGGVKGSFDSLEPMMIPLALDRTSLIDAPCEIDLYLLLSVLPDLYIENLIKDLVTKGILMIENDRYVKG